MDSRIASRQEIAAIAARLREEGKKLVLTNGCFDILHLGHVRVLNASRALGDILIVGLNSDHSVRRLKGETRPVNSELDRAEVLANLRSVDYVTVFDEDTADELLKAVKPHIYAKGADYSPESLPEAPTVRSFGGEIKLLELVPGKSTTSTIGKIQSADSAS